MTNEIVLLVDTKLEINERKELRTELAIRKI